MFIPLQLLLIAYTRPLMQKQNNPDLSSKYLKTMISSLPNLYFSRLIFPCSSIFFRPYYQGLTLPAPLPLHPPSSTLCAWGSATDSQAGPEQAGEINDREEAEGNLRVGNTSRRPEKERDG